MITSAARFAVDWIEAWNAHDLDRILAHYADDVVLISPVAKQLLGRLDGRVSGMADLRAYFRRGLEAYPNLHFTLITVLAGLESVVLYYVNQNGTHVAELMQFDRDQKVAVVLPNYEVSGMTSGVTGARQEKGET